MNHMKIVFDTNVYLAAIKKKGGYASTQLKRAQPTGSYQLFISPEIILEVRHKLELKFNYSTEESANFITTVLGYATLVQPRHKVSNILKDADDHIILECALEANADAIVTADRGLLRLKEFRTIAIIRPTMLQYLR
jgi:uncharacterized protein